MAAVVPPAEQLHALGEKLQAAVPASKDALVKLLKQAANCLSEIEQSPLPSVLDSVKPFLNAIAKEELLKHSDRDVKLLVATCLCEVTRVTAPEAPYSDDELRGIFHLIVSTFSGLSDVNSPSFSRRVTILETLARYRSCVVMLDLDCNDLINEMFRLFLKVVSDDHAQSVLTSMQTIMGLIIDESEDITEGLLSILLSPLGRKRTDFSLSARKLSMSVIEHSAGKLEPFIRKFLVSSLAGDHSGLSDSINHHEVIHDIYQCAPQILSGIVDFITGELLSDELDVRTKAVELLGEIFSLPGVPILESFKPVFLEFVKRLTDRAVEVRLSAIRHLKNCLMSNPSRPEASEIIKALCDRLLDFDENVRKQVVGAIYDLACNALDSVPTDVAKLVAERTRDKSISVKRYTLERLADIYRLYCHKCSDRAADVEGFEWIPGKVLRCLFDKDFRPESIELILCDSLFPRELSIKDRVKHWTIAFSRFDKIEMKALEQILLQKQRFQQEMLKYLSLRLANQDEDQDLPRRITGCFRSMSRMFNDPLTAEDSLTMLNQLKDVNIWKILTSLLDAATNFHQAWTLRDDLLKILGEKHPLYDFMSMLSIRCSFLLVNKEYIKVILGEATKEESIGNASHLSACMDLLTIIASFFPLLLSGFEEDLIHLLKEDNEILKEGVAHILAKAGGNIREQLAITSSSIDLLLERLCLEGSRKQAKYSVHALAAITKDDGLLSLSVLYKRLVDMLEEKVHLPSILQSLGCIAQISIPIFETREDEIINFIDSSILHSCSVGAEFSNSEWAEVSENCLLKIYGIKTLVKSYLPFKDAHARPKIEKLFEILKNMLTYGDLSPNINSSSVDKAHLKLAAAKAVLQLSRHWDHKVPLDLFYMTLRISEDDYPQARKLFLAKVNQYIKERHLDPKYACAFLLSVQDYHTPEFEECKHDLFEVVQVCQQIKLRQISVQSEINLLVAYPEYVTAFLVHALAHDPFYPGMDEWENTEVFGPLYWRLHLFLSVMLTGDEVLQQGAPSMKKESFIAIVSIFRSIKCAEDTIDVSKTKALHAISDVGLSIAKRMFHEEIETGGYKMVPLPTSLYKQPEDGENDIVLDDEKETWLGCEKVVSYFEAVKMRKDTVGEVDVTDKMSLDSIDDNGHEVPLGKMLQILKSKGVKKKQIKNIPSDGNDVDVMGVVREINLDSIERSLSTSKARSNNKTGLQNSIGKLSSSHKKQMERDDHATVATPKRKRSVTVQRVHSEKVKKDAKEKTLLSSVKGKVKGFSESFGTDLAAELGHLNGSFSHKRKGAFSLSKCSNNREDLVGSRVKVWWPLDKQFYEGSVQSYDSEQDRHLILYNDGDIEVLDMAKEKWEFVSPAPKRHKPHASTSHDEMSHDKKSVNSSSKKSEQQLKKPTKSPTKQEVYIGKNEHHGKKSSGMGTKSKNGGNIVDVKSRLPKPKPNTPSDLEVEDAGSDHSAGESWDTVEESQRRATKVKRKAEHDESSINGAEESLPLSSWRKRTTKA